MIDDLGVNASDPDDEDFLVWLVERHIQLCHACPDSIVTEVIS
jgi:hypothetical protein